MFHSWKVTLKHAIPPELLNALLLRFPSLYHTKLVFYETNLRPLGGIDELLAQLARVLDVDGQIIEYGSSRCGASVIMAQYLRSQQVNKKILASDSNVGFDRSELAREQGAGLTTANSSAFTSTSYQNVRRKVAALGFQDTVIPIQGYFHDSLPSLSGPFCLALIDCDLRDSLVYSAETVWPNLSHGGRILCDDYADQEFRGAQPGVDMFIENHCSEIAEHGLLNRLDYACKA